MSPRNKKTNRARGVAPAPSSALVVLANQQIRDAKFVEAEATARRIIALDRGSVDGHLLLAEALHRRGKPHDAVIALRAVTDKNPRHAVAHYRCALILCEAGRGPEAEFSFLDAIAADPNFAEAHLDLGNFYASEKKMDAAEAAYRKSTEVRPSFGLGHYNLGNLLRESGRLEDAVAAYQAAAQHKPNYVPAWYNLGITLKMLGRNEAAIEAYSEAIKRRPNHADAINNLGLALRSAGRFEEAEAAFRRALAIKVSAAPYFNLGAVLRDLGRTNECVVAMEKCLALQPGFAMAARQLAEVYMERDRHADAEKVLRRSIDCNADNRNARVYGLEGLANLFKDQDKILEAAETFAAILRLEPEHPEAFSGLCHAKASMCDWRGRDEEFAQLMKITERQIAADQRTAFSSFSALARPLSPAMHLAIGRTWANDTKREMAGWRKRLAFTFDRSRRHDRLRIGYVSQDFRNQAMGHLTRTMYGLHDRSEFEIFGYSVRANDRSIYRKTIEAGCEHFADIDKVPAAEGAKRIHADEIDIMIDLMGYTAGNRMRITALHPAPVVVGFLRFPGSSGADFVDYMLTDPVVTTPADQPDYSEKLVFLPHCYQPNDWTQEIDPSPITRAEFGLPEDTFVFSCFNNHYKLEPFIFDVWMRILQQVPNSVLWLMQFNPPMADNLRREAAARGISPERLVFARKIGKDRHLARQKLADLFLDTRYYTSHTTGSDALWGGLPVLTCASDSFASRVTASLLLAAGLPELLVPSFEEYERRAVHLAIHPAELKAIRDKWAAQRTTCALFDTKRFVRNLERAYRLIWDDYSAGRAPRQLFANED